MDNALNRAQGQYAYLPNRHLIEDFLTLFRKDPEFVRQNMRRRGEAFEKLFNEAKDLDTHWRRTKQEIEGLRAQVNKATEGIRQNPSNDDLKHEAATLKRKQANLELAYTKLTEQRETAINKLPNLLADDVPVGLSDDDNRLLHAEGKFKVFREDQDAFYAQVKGSPGVQVELVGRKPTHHFEITTMYGLADYEVATHMSGARSYMMKDKMVQIELATVLYLVQKLAAKGFRVVMPPYMVKKWVEAGATYFEAFEETLYKIQDEDLYLIPTSEHPLAAMNQGRTFKAQELPLRYCGYSVSFRKEAGAHGKDTKGMFRVHQFDKVEQFSITTPENSFEELDYLIGNAEEIVRDFGIPFRKVLVCTGEMDKKATIHLDIEGWFPGQSKFRELGSYGNVTDWQSRKLQIKFVQGEAKRFVHTIYGTAAPLQRFLLACFENNIKDDGSIRIPTCIKRYLDFAEIVLPIEKNKSA